MTTLDKAAIKKLVLDLRKLLEEDYEATLRRYGLFTDREWLPDAAKLPRATPELLHERARMVAAMRPEVARIRAAGVREERKAEQEAARWYIRETAFTLLNRLVGLKCLEVRGLFPEVIGTRIEYGGRSQYHRDWREASGSTVGTDDGLPAMLLAAFREVTSQIGTLFDPDSDSSVVLPRYTTLKTAIERINELPVAWWREDEIVGWIYQFYNAEEKEAIRKRGKPRLPIEVAVINQFFTPRWVVKFLVDNTLGRIWLEMHPDSPRVRAMCDYLVPEPLADAETGPDGERRVELDPDSPINNPHATRRRAPKLPQALRLIDPACGAMHFGHYAFEVFTAIYRDAREQGYLPASQALGDLEIPAAILANNLYGVDIDLRAVQLAALALYLKARTALRDLGMDNSTAATQPWRVNLVSADARLPANGLRERFLSEYEDDPVLQRAWRELFAEMEDIAQVGSLLRVEQRFRAILEQRRPPTVRLADAQQQYMPGLEPDTRQLSFADAAKDDWAPRRSLRDMLEHLRGFARAAFDTADVNAQLFANEAEKALGLLDVLMQDYDVVVMNPPFGSSTTPSATEYLRKLYPISYANLLCAFVERAQVDLARNTGYTGAILDKTFLLKMSYRKFREQIILDHMSIPVIADLGWEMLDDAQVETLMLVCGRRGDSRGRRTTCFKLDKVSITLRNKDFEIMRRNLEQRIAVTDVHITDMERFRFFANSSFAYWTPPSVLDTFREFPALDPTTAKAREGVHPLDADNFIRLFWEVQPGNIGHRAKWVPVANGGGYSPFYRDNDRIIFWENNGEAIQNFPTDDGKVISGMRNPGLQFAAGLTYGKRTDFLNIQRLEKGHIFTHEGLGVFPNNTDSTWAILAVLNSVLIRYTINTMCGQHKLSGYVGQLPFPLLLPTATTKFSSLAIESYSIRRYWDTSNEICTRFDRPWLLKIFDGNPVLPVEAQIIQREPPVDLERALDELVRLEEAADVRLQAIQAEIDDTVFELYAISAVDRTLIERELGTRPPELVWPQLAGKSKAEKRKEHVRRLLSYELLGLIQADPDGVIPLISVPGEPGVVERLRGTLEARFGPAALRIEDTATRLLGRSLQQWFESGDFIKWHTTLYKNRPVIWQLTSERGAFSALVYYHHLSADTLPRLRSTYLRPMLDDIGVALRAASERGDLGTGARLEELADELRVLDERLAAVVNADYNPAIDDGVKRNIEPLQTAGVLKYKVV